MFFVFLLDSVDMFWKITRYVFLFGTQTKPFLKFAELDHELLSFIFGAISLCKVGVLFEGLIAFFLVCLASVRFLSLHLKHRAQLIELGQSFHEGLVVFTVGFHGAHPT